MSEITEGSLLIAGGRRRGRPKSDVPQVSVHARIPEPDYDRLARLALKHDVSMASILRHLVARRVRLSVSDK